MPYAKNGKINIYYESIGEGEPIVFHHGNGNAVQDWHTFGYVEKLAKDFQLILIDSRGYGKSSKPHDPKEYSLLVRAEDTIAVLDALNISRAHCLGGSIGASVCFFLARYFPDRFKSYIFATPYFTQANEKSKEALGQGIATFVLSLEERHHMKFDNPKVRQTFLANDALAVLAANSSEWFDYLDYIQYVTHPSLIYVGSTEPSVNSLTALSEKLPDCALHILEGIDHKTAYWNSELVAPLIKTFVSKVEKGRK